MREYDTNTHRFVAIRPGALGDTLLVFPALALLRRAHPDAHITLVGRRDVLSLAYAWGLADAVSPYDAPEWSALFAATPPDESPLRSMFASAVAIAWLADADGRIAANLRALGTETVAFGLGRPREDSPIHAVIQLAGAAAALGVPVPADTSLLYAALPPLRLDSSEGTARTVGTSGGCPHPVAQPSKDLVALHAGSGSAAKCWPPECFAALSVEITRLGLRPILIEGPQDTDITRAVLAEAAQRDTVPAVARELDMVDLARLLAGCAAYVGNDSGASHLAGMLGLRTLALFGPTDPAIWSPLGPHVRALRSPTGMLADLPIASVAASLRDLLSL